MRISENMLRLMAGCFAGTGALILIAKGDVTSGVAILGTMLGFFVGEHNGQKKARETK